MPISIFPKLPLSAKTVLLKSKFMDILPFIIEDNIKMFYYRGLKEWNREKGYLKDTCLSAQDKYKMYLDYFGIQE